MTAMDEAEMQKVFRLIDADGSGHIDAKELKEAMLRLGVKVSNSSVSKVLKLIDQDNNGTVEWDEFKTFFAKVSDPDELKKLLAKQNHRFFEYKQQVKDDPSFTKTFTVPPGIAQNRLLRGHGGDVEAVAWISDKRLISGSIEGDILIWELKGTQAKLGPEKTLQSSALYSLAMGSDGKRFISGHSSKTKSLQLWSLEQEEIIQTYAGHNEAVHSCIFTTRSSLASGTKTGTLFIHDATEPVPLSSWKGHDSSVNSIDIKRNSDDILCTASRDGTVKVFDVKKSSKPVLAIDDAAASETVNRALWRNEHEIISCGDDYCIKRWDIRAADQGPVSSYFGHSSPVRTIALSPDGRFLVSGTHCGSVRVWLVDELGIIADMSEKASKALRDAEKEVLKQQSLRESGEGNLEDLMDANEEKREAEEELAECKLMRDEREMMACTQSKLGLSGPTLPLNAIAWKDTHDDAACVACGSQDQMIRLYQVDKREIASISPWSKQTAKASDDIWSRQTTVNSRASVTSFSRQVTPE